MRERIRWKIAELLDELPGQCWADLVFWVRRDRREDDGRNWNPWSPITSTCRSDALDGACYCGKLRPPDGGTPNAQ